MPFHDGDGDSDLMVVNDGAPNELYRNDGNGGFTKVTTAGVVPPGFTRRSSSEGLGVGKLPCPVLILH